MEMKRLIFLVAAVLSCSCGKDRPDVGRMPCDGSLSISFNTGVTRASAENLTEEEKKAGLAEGSLFNDLWLWIVHDSSDELRYFIHVANMFDVAATYEQEFRQVERGNYTLYAVANFSKSRFDGYYPSDARPDELWTGAEKGIINADFMKFTLSRIEEDPTDDVDGKVPPSVSVNGGRMPVSLVKHFSVAAGDNHVHAELKRVCGRLSVAVRNLSPNYPLAVSRLALSRHNPVSGYLFTDGYNVPDTEFDPFFDEFGRFPKTGADAPEYVMIEPLRDRELLSQHLYETGMGISLGLDLEGAVMPAGTEPQVGSVPGHYETGNPGMPEDGLSYVVKNVSSGLVLSVSSDNAAASGYPSGLLTDKSLIWKYGNSSGQSSLKNEGDGRYLSVGSSVNLSDNATFETSSSDDGYYIRKRNRGQSYYYMGVTDKKLDIKNTLISNTIWQYLPATYVPPVENVIVNGLKPFGYHTDAVQVINEYGVSVPLDHISRNQDVRIIVNISYNPYSGEFEFAVENWEVREMDDIHFD